MQFLPSLNREQKEAIGLLQIGTFLEYFDLMLYIHMAVLLNDLFFPKTDPETAALLAAFTFCATYVMRPLGALIFGWIGDNIGRKSTIILTTVMMSISCILMANLPTYAQIGITAGWIMTLCRVFQGLSSMGEIIGAQIYVAETIPRPLSYPAVGFISLAASVGAMVSLGVATLVTSYYMNWRIAFWIGACVALIGAVARTRLRETPDFLKLKRQKMQESIQLLMMGDKAYTKRKSRKKITPWKEPVARKTILSYFLIFCGWPLSFYLAYIYFNPLLKNDFGYSANDIIKHNFYLSIIPIASGLFWALLSLRFHPIRILKVKCTLAILLMLLMPFMIEALTTNYQLFCIQALILFIHLGATPGDAVLFYHLPIYRRFTFASFIYAATRAIMYIITSFGLVYLSTSFGIFGIWILTLPISFGHYYGLRHFQKLETKIGIYPNLVRASKVSKPQVHIDQNLPRAVA